MARIMLVDDEKSLLDVFVIMLQRQGHEIVGTASDGMGAVDLFRSLNGNVDIVFMDYRMTGMNGIDAMMKIRQMNPNTKVIIQSADVGVRRRALESGASDFLEKPFGMTVLLRAVSKAVTDESI